MQRRSLEVGRARCPRVRPARGVYAKGITRQIVVRKAGRGRGRWGRLVGGELELEGGGREGKRDTRGFGGHW